MKGLSTDRRQWDRALEVCEEIERERPFNGPGLEKTQEVLMTVTSGGTSAAHHEFHQLLYSLGIVSPDNHPGTGYRIAEYEEVADLNSEDLAQLITIICRGDRFADGLLNHYINTGLMTRAFRRLHALEFPGTQELNSRPGPA